MSVAPRPAALGAAPRGAAPSTVAPKNQFTREDFTNLNCVPIIGIFTSMFQSFILWSKIQNLIEDPNGRNYLVAALEEKNQILESSITRNYVTIALVLSAYALKIITGRFLTWTTTFTLLGIIVIASNEHELNRKSLAQATSVQ